MFADKANYRQIPNISHTLGSNQVVDHSDVVIGIDHDTVCPGVVGTAIRHSTSCAGRRAAACGHGGRQNECCAGLQYQP